MNELRQSSEGEGNSRFAFLQGLCYLVGPQFRYG